jgi:hypothetical protein
LGDNSDILYGKMSAIHQILTAPLLVGLTDSDWVDEPDDHKSTGSDSKLLNHVKTTLKKKFEMTDLEFLDYFLSLQVLQTNEGIFISQSKYACDLLHHFHMNNCKPNPSPF